MDLEEILEESLKQLQLTHSLRTRVIKETNFNELPRQKMMALVDLKFFGKSKLKDIAEKVSESPQSLCMIYNSLEKIGLVKREIDKSDRRNTFYSITKKGENLLEKRGIELKKTLHKLFNQIKKDDLEEFGKALKTINKTIKEYF